MEGRRKSVNIDRFIAWLQDAMARRGLANPNQLAAASGVPQGTLAGWFVQKGKRQHQPSETNVRRLAQYFKVPAEFLLELAGYPAPPRLVAADWIREVDDPELLLLFQNMTTLTTEQRDEIKRFMRFMMSEFEK